MGIGFAAGAALGGAVEPLGAGPWAVLLGASGAILAACLAWPGRRLARWGLAAAALALGVTGAGLERIAYERAPLRVWVASLDEGESDVVQLEGTLAADPDESFDRWILLVDVNSIEHSGRPRALAGRVRLYVGGEAERPTLSEGDRIRTWARLVIPRGRANPGGFDAEGHAFRRGVHALGFCKSPALISRLGRGPVGWVRDRVSRLRQGARERLLAAIRPGPASGIVRAMVLGDRAGLAPETEEAFRIAGTYHVLALSGAQVALVAGLLLWPLRRLRVPPVWRLSVAGGGVVLYALFVGGEIPVARAAVMAVVLLLGTAFDLEGGAANLLGLAGLGLLVHRPSSIADVSFQLSFAATLAIILLVPPLSVLTKALPKAIGLLLTASLAAQIGVTPLLALHFHRLAPAALLLNLAAVPLSSVVLLAGFGVVFLAGWAPPLAVAAVFVAEISARLLVWSGEIVRAAPWLDVRVPSPSAGLLALYVAATIALVRGPRLRPAVVLLLGAAVVGLILGTGPPPGDGRLWLTVLDVGDGDSLVLRSPAGRMLLVDAGASRPPAFDAGEAVAAPFLWSQGIRRVDGLFLSHPHNDHAGGVPAVVRLFRPREVLHAQVEGEEVAGGPLGTVLRSSAAPEACRVSRGFHRVWDGVEIEALWPPGGGPERPSRANDASLVLRVRYGDAVFLLSGDIGAAVETQIHAGPVDVLKVPHHGSPTSSSPGFVAELAPRVAIISRGRRNDWSGGVDEVSERYRRAGAQVYRTDRDGAVTVATDGQTLWIGAGRGPVTVLAHRARRS